MRLLPREEKFYHLFLRQVEIISDASRLLLESVLAGNSRLKSAADEISELEHRGDEVIHEEMLRAHVPAFDSRGNLWFNSRNMAGKAPAFCQAGSNNPFTKYWLLTGESPTAINYYDQKTGKFAWVETCFNTHHIQIANEFQKIHGLS